ncbi:MAG: fumarylacetoacetate hydrolase family protein [Novosphingobium sp.]
MLDRNVIEKIADIVDEAQSSARAIAKITDAYPTMTVDDGYGVQDVLLRRWLERGREFYGYKAGLTSRAKMVQMGVDVPAFGLMMRDTCDPDGGTIPTAGLIHPRVEAEIAFVMSRDLAGPEVSIEEIYDATDYVQPAIEIIDSRFENFRFDLPSVVADNCSSARLVMGGRPRRPREVDLATLGCVLEINGDPVDFAASGAILGHPAHVIQLLVSWLHGRGQVLKAGTVVLAGAMTAAHAIKPGDAICARFQDMGSINVKVS